VRIRFYAWGYSGVDNPQDLTEQNPGSEYFFDPNTLAEQIYTGLGMTISQARAYLEPYGGTWGLETDTTGYFKSAGFIPLHGADAFTVGSWILPADETKTSWDKIWSQYENSSDYLGLQHRESKVYFIAKYANTYYEVSIDNLLENYHAYYISCSWSINQNFTIAAWDITEDESYYNSSAIGLGTAFDLPTGDFAIADRGDGTYQFDGFMIHLDLYARNMSLTEMQTIYEGGIGFVYDSTGLNNSWSFDEYSDYGYASNEQTLHDGIGVFNLRETWDVDGAYQSMASFLFPWPNAEPVFWIWLIGGVCGVIAVPIIFARKMKDSDDKFKLGMLLFICLAMVWALFVGLS
jgi:hypothetical protein